MMDETLKEEEQPVTEKNDADNEILTTVSDEYLAKKKKKRMSRYHYLVFDKRRKNCI